MLATTVPQWILSITIITCAPQATSMLCPEAYRLDVLQRRFLRSVLQPPRNIHWTLPRHEILHQWNGRIPKFIGQPKCKPWSEMRSRHHWNLAHYAALLPDHRCSNGFCIGTLVGAHGLDARNILGTTLKISATSKMYLHGRWLLWIMISGVQCFPNFQTSASAAVYRKQFHICSPVPETGCHIGHTGLAIDDDHILVAHECWVRKHVFIILSIHLYNYSFCAASPLGTKTYLL